MLDVGQGGATLVRTTHHTLLFDAGPLRPDGSDCLTDEGRAPLSDAAALGADLARRLLARAPADFFTWRR